MTNRSTVRAAARNVRFEGLEQRKLFATGGISGYLYHDLNGDNYRDYSEPVSSTHAVYIDLDNSGTHDAEEPLAYGTSVGYAFTGLENGTYVLRLLENEMGAGEFATTPSAGKVVSVQYGWTNSGQNLGYATTGSIVGHSYEETSPTSSSFSSSDNIVTGRTVYLDLNNNRALDDNEPSVVTPATGKGYRFDGLKPGTYTLRQIVPEGWYGTTSVDVPAVRSGQSVTSNLGSRPIATGTGALSVELFHDLNANKTRETFESQFSYYSNYVYLDLNKNGVKDGSDLAPSLYSVNVVTFAGLAPGTYEVGFNYTGTYVASGALNPLVVTAGALTHADYGVTNTAVTLNGTVFNDLDRDGVKDSNETTSIASAMRVYVDVNDNGVYETTEPSTTVSIGAFSIYNVPVGTYSVRVSMSPDLRLSHQSADVAAGSTYNTTGVLAIPNDLLFAAGSTSTTTSLTFGAYRTSTISGAVINDLNRNGSQNSGETGIEGRTVFIDADNDGVLDDGETTTTTSTTGAYTFTGLEAGTYTIRAVLPTGWAQSYPTGNAAIVSIIGQGDQLTGKNYLQYLIPTTGKLNGSVFHDDNGDGIKNFIDRAFAGVTVFIDANDDGQFDEGERSTATASDGSWSFELPAGAHRVRYLLPSSTIATTSVTPPPATVVTSGQTTMSAVGLFQAGYVRTRFFYDAAGDGDLNRADKPAVGIVALCDVDGDGVREQAISDAEGYVDFPVAKPGLYLIQVVMPAGYTHTYAWTVGVRSYSGGTMTGNSMGLTDKAVVLVTAFVDLNGNHTEEYNETNYGGTLAYADVNNNDKRDPDEPYAIIENGSGRMALAPGQHTIRLDLNEDSTIPAGLATERTITVEALKEHVVPFELSQPTIHAPKIAVVTSMPEGGSVTPGWSYTIGMNTFEWDTDYSPPSGFSADHTGNFAPKFFAGSGDSGRWHLGAIRARDAAGKLSAIGIVYIEITNVAPTATLSAIDAPAYGGAGVKFDSIVEPSAADAAALKFSYDFDNDGTFDVVDSSTSSIQLPSSLANTPGTYTVRARIADKDGGFNDYTTTVVVSPAQFGSISGVTYNDSNANGRLDAGEQRVSRVVFLDKDNDGRLDTGEVSLTSKSDGTFTFANLVPGEYKVRRVFPTGYKPSNPPRDYTLAGGQTISGADIGSVTSSTVVTPPGDNPPPSDPKTASITGRTFNDNNANGVLDAGDTIITGKTVFIDTNNNGKLDSGEQSTKSNSSGVYAFSGLAANSYYVRRVFPSGYTYSNAPINLVLSAGQAYSNADIGSVPEGTTIAPTGDSPYVPPTTPTNPPSNDTGSISGFLFWDSDRDGTFDSGESYQGGKTVFIDLDNDNILDSNERKLTTDSQGRFTFDGLLAGTYNIKRVMPKGYIATTPAQTITLGAGEIFSGVAIGTNTN